MRFDSRATAVSTPTCAGIASVSNVRFHLLLLACLVFFCCPAGKGQVINKQLPIKGDNGQVYLSAP